MRVRNALYVQGGGPTAVVNTTAAAVIEACRSHRDQIRTVYAARFGMPGVLNEDLVDTSGEPEAVLNALRNTPGSAFGSARYRLASRDEAPGVHDRFASVLAAHDIGYLFYNGGNGSAATTLQLAALSQDLGLDVTCVHIPKTIDNDLMGTDCSPGFASAAKYLAVSMQEAATDLASTHTTSTRVFILESMGRHTGWLVAAMGLATEEGDRAPSMLLFAEMPFEEGRFLARLEEIVARHGYCVVGASEGLRTQSGAFVESLPAARQGNNEQLGGVAPRLAKLVRETLGLKCHWATADYLQRSARHLASATDVAHADGVGKTAVQVALEGQTGVMPVIVRASEDPYRWKIGVSELGDIACREKTVPRNFMSDDGYSITSRCRNYLLPLIQGEAFPPFRCGLPVHVKMNGLLVPPRLPRWTIAS